MTWEPVPLIKELCFKSFRLLRMWFFFIYIPRDPDGVHICGGCGSWKKVNILICLKLPCKCCRMKSGFAIHQHLKVLMEERNSHSAQYVVYITLGCSDSATNQQQWGTFTANIIMILSNCAVSPDLYNYYTLLSSQTICFQQRRKHKSGKF